eukprot:15433025-Alexandrium_andersonii.AAC.1
MQRRGQFSLPVSLHLVPAAPKLRPVFASPPGAFQSADVKCPLDFQVKLAHEGTMREIGPGAVSASGVIGPPAPFANASAEAFLPV